MPIWDAGLRKWREEWGPGLRALLRLGQGGQSCVDAGEKRRWSSRPLSQAQPGGRGRRLIFGRLEALALLPFLLILAYHWGGEWAVLPVALAAPLWLALLRGRGGGGSGVGLRPDLAQPSRDLALSQLDQALAEAMAQHQDTACIVVALDDPQEMQGRFGHAVWAQVEWRTGERLAGVLRNADRVARLDGPCFAITLAPARRMDLETVLQIAMRLKAAAEQPLPVEQSLIQPSVSLGFCLSARAPARDGRSLLTAAETALEAAQAEGPGSLRAYSDDMTVTLRFRDSLASDVAEAIESGAISAYFQPQVSTDTGDITGMEALARWQHPQHGLLLPGQFLPVVEKAGLLGRLFARILEQALGAMQSWDRAGQGISCVAVNIGPEGLRDSSLVDSLRWELERFEIAPDRLAIEILETVMADSRSTAIAQTIAALSQLGCRIDLDDFGTGSASIASIRRFGVQRLKIDRSFVQRLDSDSEQRRMVGAILSLAEQLGLETLAEGVETPGEHALLAQLGCSHVQGYCIARPMPLHETLGWIEGYRATRLQPPPILRKSH